MTEPYFPNSSINCSFVVPAGIEPIKSFVGPCPAAGAIAGFTAAGAKLAPPLPLISLGGAV